MAHEKNTRKKGGVGKILLVLVVLLALAVGGALLFAHNEISGNGRPGTEVTVSIPQGSGVSVIAQKLKDAGVIRSAYLFRWYVGQKGAASKLQYGDFTLQKSACSYDAIIAVLSTYAKAETVRVTIPEGTTAIAICPEDGSRRAVQRRGFPEGSPTRAISANTPSGSTCRTMPTRRTAL